MDVLKFTLRVETISVRGKTLHVREFTAGGRAAVLAAFREAPARAPLVACLHCLSNANGEQVCADMAQVEAMPADVVTAVADKALDLSGMRGDKRPKD